MEADKTFAEAAFVFDTNAIIYHLNDAYPPERTARVDAWISEGALVSVVTRIEVLGYEQPAVAEEEAKQFLSLFTEVALPEAVVRQTIALRKVHAIKLPDAVIASTALDAGVPLVTRNAGDFSGIGGLALLDPFAD